MSLTVLEERTTDAGPDLLPLTVGQYEQMLSTGILHDGDAIELVDGMLILKDRRSVIVVASEHDSERSPAMSHAPRHALVVARTFRILDRLVETHGLHVRMQLPVVLNEQSAPEPDCSVVLGTLEDFATRHPRPAEIQLVVEVSDSSLRYDRTTKLRLYSTANIPRYWIVNLPANEVIVWESPDSSAGTYSSETVISANGVLRLPVAEAIFEISVSDLLA
jgi:Uma2 family endonuclease